jgi:hypothetical protein
MKKDIKKHIEETIKKYQPVLLLNRNTFEVKYGTENKEALMECVFNYPYLNVTLKYSDKCEEDYKNGKDIIPYVIHEMCHVITDPLYSKATERYVSRTEILDERELLTDYICNIVVINLQNKKH